MTAFSWTLGRIFGVELRIHAFLVLLLPIMASWSAAVSGKFGRGLLLWLLLILCLAIREIARALALAWTGLEPSSLLLLPFGGLVTLRGTDAVPRLKRSTTRYLLAWTGPAASFLFAAILAALILSVSPQVSLFDPHWISPLHLLRSLVWMSTLLGILHLLPAWPLDGGLLWQDTPAESPSSPSTPARPRHPLGLAVPGRVQIAPIVVLLIIFFALATLNWLLIGFGIVSLLYGQSVRQSALSSGTARSSAKVRDVMLTDYTVLGAASTLDDALAHARHSLEEIFPVVRGHMLVGAISRQSAQAALNSGGNVYIQGLMSKDLIPADPDEPVLDVLARVRPNSAQLVPVVIGDRVIGLLTPQHLAR